MFIIEIKGNTPKELNNNIIRMAQELAGEKQIETLPKQVSFDDMQKDGEASYSDTSPSRTPLADQVIRLGDSFPTPFRRPSPSVEEPSQVANEKMNMNDLDSKGMPYDERIHTSARTVVKDGSWRYKKGLTDQTIEACEKQTRERLGMGETIFTPPTQMSAPQQPQVFQAPPPPAPTIAVPVFTPPPVAPVAAAPVQAYVDPIAPPQSSNVPAYDLHSFKVGFVNFMTKLIGEKKVDRDYIKGVASYFGLNDIWEITKDDAKLLELFNTYASYGWLTKVG